MPSPNTGPALRCLGAGAEAAMEPAATVFEAVAAARCSLPCTGPAGGLAMHCYGFAKPALMTKEHSLAAVQFVMRWCHGGTNKCYNITITILLIGLLVEKSRL